MGKLGRKELCICQKALEKCLRLELREVKELLQGRRNE